jgi:hypothetical protein
LMATRDFDITWVKRAPTNTRMEGAGSVEQTDSARPHAERLLGSFSDQPKALHVLDVAKASGVSFEEALRGVLHLVGENYLEIVERDKIADADHLVRLTEKGRKELETL